MEMTREQQIAAIEKDWAENPRWTGVTRTYSAEDVVRLRGSIQPANTIADRGARKLWDLVNGDAKKGYVNCLGALTAGQAMQQVKAGIEAIYLSGWQVAADNNTSLSMYPDQSLYAVNSVPTVVQRINNAFRRADQIQWKAGKNPTDADYVDYFAPIVADAEAGFGGVLNAYELMKAMIEAGAAGVHFEDQLASVKKCGHMGGKVLVPTQEAVQKLIAARLAADVAGVPTIVLARTDANAADLLTSDCDPYDQSFTTVSAQPKASIAFVRVSTKPFHVDSPMHPMRICSGVKQQHRILTRRRSSQKRSRRNIRISCWRITVHRRLTGRRTWMTPPLRSSKRNFQPWATSISSSPWRVFTTCGTTCLSLPITTHAAKA